MHSTAYPISIQPLLFPREELSRCFFTEPTDDELSFLEMWENLVSAMPATVSSDDGNSRTGRPGYTLLSVLAVHAVRLFFRLKTLTAARERLLSSMNLRTITGMDEVPSPAVVFRKTDDLISLVDFDSVIASICSSFYEDRLVCHLSIDSTVVGAREKPVKNMKEKKKRETGTEEERFQGTHHRR